jgi:hypothetical protein
MPVPDRSKPTRTGDLIPFLRVMAREPRRTEVRSEAFFIWARGTQALCQFKPEARDVGGLLVNAPRA